VHREQRGVEKQAVRGVGGAQASEWRGDGRAVAGPARASLSAAARKWRPEAYRDAHRDIAVQSSIKPRQSAIIDRWRRRNRGDLLTRGGDETRAM
jgi:hypothetical protein